MVAFVQWNTSSLTLGNDFTLPVPNTWDYVECSINIGAIIRQELNDNALRDNQPVMIQNNHEYHASGIHYCYTVLV